jgi:BRCT domain type II-containing protein
MTTTSLYIFSFVSSTLQGAPGCLTGLTIVVTGVLESLHREEAEGLVKKYGSKAPKAVSKNTTYLLAGDDAGPSKLSKVSPSPGPSHDFHVCCQAQRETVAL